MRILVFYQYYLAPNQAGGSRFNELSRLWAEAGHEVTVVCGTLNHITGEIPEKYRGRWWTVEQDGPVRVWRCHVPSAYFAGYAGRALGFAGFALSSFTAALAQARPDVIIASSPPLPVTIPAWAAHLRHMGVPWIFEVRDLWPESAVTTGVLSSDSLVTKALYAYEALAYRSADCINVLTPAFRDDIVGRGLASADKITMIPNGPDIEQFQTGLADEAVRARFGWGDKFVVLYAGAHGRANALGQLVNAADELRGHPNILIATVGGNPNERAALQEEIDRRGLDNIVLHGPQPKDDMPEIIRAADVGTAVLQDNPTFRTVYPNKVFDYMACGRPTLLAIDGIIRDVVCEQAKAGLFVKPEDGPGIAQAILELEGDADTRRAMGERGREWVVGNVSRQWQASHYLEVMERLVAERA